MILMRAERLATPAPASSREGALEAENITLKAQVKALVAKNTALEAELARYRGAGTMIPLEAFAALQRVITATAAIGGSTVDEIRGPRKRKRLCLLRQAAMYIAYRDVGRLSYPQIARHFDGRDHTTALHAMTKIQRDIDAGVATTIELLRDIRAAAGIGGAHT